MCPSPRYPFYGAPDKRQGQLIPHSMYTHSTSVNLHPLGRGPGPGPGRLHWAQRDGAQPEPGTHAVRSMALAARAMGVTDGLRPGGGEITVDVARSCPAGACNLHAVCATQARRLTRALRRTRSEAPRPNACSFHKIRLNTDRTPVPAAKYQARRALRQRPESSGFQPLRSCLLWFTQGKLAQGLKLGFT